MSRDRASDSSNRRRRIVVLEPNFRGHRMDYVKQLWERAPALNVELVLASSSDTLTSDEYRLRFGPVQPNPRFIDLGPLPDIRSREYWDWLTKSVMYVVEVETPDRLVILEGDKFLPYLVLRRRPRGARKITILIMRYPEKSMVRSRALMAAVAKVLLALIARLRGHDVVALAPSDGNLTRHKSSLVRWVPDPISLSASNESIAAYRKAVSMISGSFWFGLFGHITERKCADLVARAAAEVATIAPCGLLIAGRFGDGERERCASAFDALVSAGGQLIIDDRLLSDEELDSAIGAVDAVVIAYTTPGPSGILAKATAMSKALLVAGRGVGAEALDPQQQTRRMTVELSQNAVAAAMISLITQFDRNHGIIYAEPVDVGSTAALFAQGLLDWGDSWAKRRLQT